jgi:hypothetical protein
MTVSLSAEKRLSFWYIAGIVFLALTALSAVIVSLPPHDFWWQLRTGEIIAHERRLPSVDRFSYTARGEPWLIHEWLSCLIFFSIQHRFGFDALIVLQFLLMAVVIGALSLSGRARGADFLLSMAGAALTMWAIRPWLALRPQLFTYVLLAIFLFIGEAARRNAKPYHLLWLIPLTPLWANLHAGVLLAPILLMLEALSAGIETGWRTYFGKEEGPTWTWFLWLMGSGIMVALLTLANPYGFGLWRYPGQVTGHPIVTGFITEWFSPDFHAWGLYPLDGLIGLLLIVQIVRGPQPPLRDLLVLGLLLTMGMLYRRNLPLFAIAACPVLVGRTDEILRSFPWGFRRYRGWVGSVACALSVWPLWGAILHFPAKRVFAAQTGEYDFPEGAVRYLAQSPPSGPLFNEYRWGGYLIWRLRSVPVFIDGRAEIYYRKEIFDHYVNIVRLQPGWREMLEKYHIQTILMETNAPVVQALLQDPQWRVAYGDRQATALEKRER